MTETTKGMNNNPSHHQNILLRPATLQYCGTILSKWKSYWLSYLNTNDKYCLWHYRNNTDENAAQPECLSANSSMIFSGSAHCHWLFRILVTCNCWLLYCIIFTRLLHFAVNVISSHWFQAQNSKESHFVCVHTSVTRNQANTDTVSYTM